MKIATPVMSSNGGCFGYDMQQEGFTDDLLAVKPKRGQVIMDDEGEIYYTEHDGEWKQ